MKKNLLLVLSAATVCVAFSGVQTMVPVDDVLRLSSEVTAERYPDSDVVYVSDRVDISYEKDGTFTFRNEEWVKALTDRGVRQLSSFDIGYNARYEDAEIEDISFLNEDGSLVPVPFRETLKVATDNHSMHSNIVDPMAKEMSCSVPGVKVGTVIRRLRTERAFKSRLGNNWSIIMPLEYHEPLHESLVTLSAPPELPLRCQVLRNAVSNTVTASRVVSGEDARLHYAWTARRVPKLFAEPWMPSGTEALQSLRLSTFKDWPAVSAWYWGLCEGHLAKTNAAMVAKAGELTASCADDAERISSVFKFVSQQVRYMGLTMEDEAPGYEPHDIDITFGNLYGVCRDKAALLAALLRLAGYEAYPTLVNVGAAMDEEVPNPYFNHAIVAVSRASVAGDISSLGQKMDQKYLLLDPTNEMTKDLLPAYLAGKSYLVARPDGEGIRTAAIATADENAVSVETEVTLQPGGGGLVTYAVTLDGIAAERYREWFAWLTPGWRGSQLKNVLSREAPSVFRDAELVAVRFEPRDLTDTSKPMQVFATFGFPSLVRREADADVFLPPFLTDAINPFDDLSVGFYLESRRFPLRFMSTMARRERMSVHTYGALGAPVSLPVPADIRSGDWSFFRKAEVTNGVFVLERDERLENIRFSASGYGDLRARRADADIASRAECRFEKADADLANSRRILQRHVDWVTGPYDWVSTNETVTLVKKVGGKREVAELKLLFNPPCRDLKLVAATTYGPDGTPHPITDKEINVMDSHAAASAPRYGNGRLLVANLPSVEVGCTVSTVVERVVRNASSPYFSYRVFAEEEPADFIEHEIHFAPGLEPKLLLANNEAGAVVVEDAVGEDGWRTVRWTRRALPARAREWCAPSWDFDSPTGYATLVDWNAYGRLLADEMDAAVRRDGDGEARRLARDLAEDCSDPAEKIVAVMRYLKNHVRVVHPDDDWRMPRGTRYFGPDRTLADGYCSHADRALLVRSMLKELGFDCEVRLAYLGSDPKDFARVAETGRHQALNMPMIHAEWRTGLWPFRSVEPFDLMVTASGYDEPRSSLLANRFYFCPETGALGRFPEPKGIYANLVEERTVIDLSASGDAEFDVERLTYGAGVGAFRESWSETTPEWLTRRHGILSRQVAGNAAPVGRLAFDATNCPARLRFQAKADRFAALEGGVMTVNAADCERINRFLPQLGVGTRRLPICVDMADRVSHACVIRFPEGYTEVVRLPDPFELVAPTGAVWARLETGHDVRDGRLEVTLRLSTARSESSVFDSSYADWLRLWSGRLANAFRGISARRP